MQPGLVKPGVEKLESTFNVRRGKPEAQFGQAGGCTGLQLGLVKPGVESWSRSSQGRNRVASS